MSESSNRRREEQRMYLEQAYRIPAGEILLSSAYLAPVSYYRVLTQADEVVLEQHDYYQKQTYRNRCTIVGGGGAMALSIPVEKTNAKCSMRDVRISVHADWQQLHWRSMESAYNSSPFYEYYKDDLRPFYEKKWTFLWDLNQALQEKMCELLAISPLWKGTDQYRETSADDVRDLREKIHPKKAPLWTAPDYYQVFREKLGFIPDLSIVDLLFNAGNESLLILSAPITQKHTH